MKTSDENISVTLYEINYDYTSLKIYLILMWKPKIAWNIE